MKIYLIVSFLKKPYAVPVANSLETFAHRNPAAFINLSVAW